VDEAAGHCALGPGSILEEVEVDASAGVVQATSATTTASIGWRISLKHGPSGPPNPPKGVYFEKLAPCSLEVFDVFDVLVNRIVLESVQILRRVRPPPLKRTRRLKGRFLARSRGVLLSGDDLYSYG